MKIIKFLNDNIPFGATNTIDSALAAIVDVTKYAGFIVSDDTYRWLKKNYRIEIISMGDSDEDDTLFNYDNDVDKNYPYGKTIFSIKDNDIIKTLDDNKFIPIAKIIYLDVSGSSLVDPVLTKAVSGPVFYLTTKTLSDDLRTDSKDTCDVKLYRYKFIKTGNIEKKKFTLSKFKKLVSDHNPDGSNIYNLGYNLGEPNVDTPLLTTAALGGLPAGSDLHEYNLKELIYQILCVEAED